MQPRLYYASSLIGGLAFIAVGIATGSSWLIFCGCVGPVLGIAFTYFGRRRLGRPHGPAWSTNAGSRTLTPVPLPPLPLAGFRWTGGCNVPCPTGRANATYPFSLLLAAPGWARIEMRPGIAQRLIGYQPVTYVPGADTVVFPAGSRLRLGGGIGLQTGVQPPSYFWTNRQPLILSALAGCGFTVKWEEAVAKLW